MHARRPQNLAAPMALMLSVAACGDEGGEATSAQGAAQGGAGDGGQGGQGGQGGGGQGGAAGFSLSLDGIDGEMTTGSVADIVGPTFTEVTMSAWVKRPTNEPPATNGIVVLGDGDFSDTVYLFWSTEEGNSIALYAGGMSAHAPIADSTRWTHVTAVYDATETNEELRVYLDGDLAATGTGTTMTHQADGQVYIGKFGVSPLYLAGSLDEVAIWSTALAPDEVAAIASPSRDLGSDTGAYVSSATLRSWWRMGDAEGGEGTTVRDEGGIADGTLAGGATLIPDAP